MTATIDTTYDATSLKTLEGLEPVRARPGMYIGSTDERGLAHLVYELMDNATDEAIGGYANQMVVTLYDDDSIEVSDNGRGIPVDVEPSSGLSGVELVMTKLHAGGKFHTDAYKVSGGLHGVGASVVNALSSKMSVQVIRDGYHWTMNFANGKPGVLEKGKKAPKTAHGTTVRFWPDRSIFTDAEINLDWIMDRCQSRAYLITGFKVRLVDKRVSPQNEHNWVSKKGMVDYASSLAGSNGICAPIVIKGSGAYEDTTRVQAEDGSMSTQKVERTCEVEVVLQWTSKYDSKVFSWANLVPTPHGGSHMNGFWQGMAKIINDYARTSKALRQKDPSISRDDIEEGLIALVQVRLPEPQFEGQTKEVLGTKPVHSVVYRVLSDGLQEWLSSRGPRNQVKAVVNKVAAAARTRQAEKEERDTLRQQAAVSSASLPDKLWDCRQHSPKSSELLIVEGKSAAGPCKAGRDSMFQAVLPLRGKIMNAGKYGIKAILENEETSAIFTSLGIVPNRFNPSDLRYERIIMMTDADVDGSHIRCLLMSLFYYYAPQLIENGHVYYASPPLYTIRQSGKPDRYAYSDAERDAILKKVGSAQHRVLRFKGLGEMDVSELTETCLDPTSRSITQVTMEDAEAAERMFAVLMGSAVEPRKEHILAHAGDIDYSKLDV